MAIATRKDESFNQFIVLDPPKPAVTDPAADTMGGNDFATPAPQGDWKLTIVANLCDAEDMLDTLERNGFENRELVVLGDESFAVRWR